MQLVVFPMFFLSGALYPVAGLPAWLEVLNRLNPLTYAVDPMRRLVFSHLDVSEAARRTLDPGVLGLTLLLAFSVTAFGVLVAVTIKQAQSFTWVMQMVVFPMFFLSGALYPVDELPAWLEVLNRINPLTYAVDLMRGLVFSHLDVSETARRTLDPGVTWLGWQVPPLVEVGMVLLLGLGMAGVAIRRFSRIE